MPELPLEFPPPIILAPAPFIAGLPADSGMETHFGKILADSVAKHLWWHHLRGCDMTHTQLSTRAFWICAIITVVSAVVSASFSVAALIGVARQDQYAMYAASRSIALLLNTSRWTA
jgi:hypothetical protein